MSISSLLIFSVHFSKITATAQDTEHY